MKSPASDPGVLTHAPDETLAGLAQHGLDDWLRHDPHARGAVAGRRLGIVELRHRCFPEELFTPLP